MTPTQATIENTISLGIIEDHKLSRVGITTLLQEHPGLQIVGEAETGKAGLELAETHRPQVMLVDLGLPDMDGIELIRKLKALLPDLIIVVLTVHDQDQLILDALVAGASAYCLKENITNQLGNTINNLCNGGAWLDPKAANRLVQLLSEHYSTIRKNSENVLSSQPAENIYNLTEREQSVLALLADGKSNGEIAQKLSVSYHTVKSDMTQLMMKLGVQDRTQAVIKALKDNLV